MISALLLASAVLTGLQQTAQDPIRMNVTDDVGCSSCRVQLERVAVIGNDPAGPRLTARAILNVRDDGTFVAARFFDPNVHVASYDSTGGFIRSVSLPGVPADDVSGVFRGPRDSLLIMQRGHVAVVDPALARVVRREQLPRMPIAPIQIDDRGVLLLPRHADAAEPFMRWNRRSPFPSIEPLVVPADRMDEVWLLSPARDNHVWAFRPNRYHLDLWRDGRHLIEIRRAASWFPSWRLADARGAAQPPRLIDVNQSGDTLWIMVRVQGSETTTGQREGPVRADVLADEGYHTIVEVLDLKARRLIATTRTLHTLAGFVGTGGLAYSTRKAGSDFVIDVWRPSVSRDERR
jgi:hypothetical protein